MHGLGDTPEAFAQLFEGLPARAHVVALRAFDPWNDGWTWFPPGLDPASAAFARAVESAADRVAQVVSTIVHAHPACGPIVLTGFSQGAMLAYTLAARHPELHATIIPMSGRLADATEVIPGSRPLHVHGLHGTADPRVPVDAARRAVARLVQAGVEADLTEFPGVGHTIDPAMRRALYQRIGDAVASGCTAP